MLYDIATHSRRRDEIAKIAIEDMEQKTKEYLAESKPPLFYVVIQHKSSRRKVGRWRERME